MPHYFPKIQGWANPKGTSLKQVSMQISTEVLMHLWAECQISKSCSLTSRKLLLHRKESQKAEAKEERNPYVLNYVLPHKSYIRAQQDDDEQWA